MKTNLSSQITLNRVSPRYYRPENAFERSVLTRLEKIPTDILVFVLSIGITVVAFIAYMQYIQQAILWYMIIAAIMAGFLVAFVAMYGWEKVAELWKRFYKGNTNK